MKVAMPAEIDAAFLDQALMRLRVEALHARTAVLEEIIQEAMRGDSQNVGDGVRGGPAQAPGQEREGSRDVSGASEGSYGTNDAWHYHHRIATRDYRGGGGGNAGGWNVWTGPEPGAYSDALDAAIREQRKRAPDHFPKPFVCGVCGQPCRDITIFQWPDHNRPSFGECCANEHRVGGAIAIGANHIGPADTDTRFGCDVPAVARGGAGGGTQGAGCSGQISGGPYREAQGWPPGSGIAGVPTRPGSECSKPYVAPSGALDHRTGGSKSVTHLADKMRRLATGTSSFTAALEAKIDKQLAAHEEKQQAIHDRVDKAFSTIGAINADADEGITALEAELKNLTNQ